VPPPLRRREYMMRVEALILAAAEPVTCHTLAMLIGSDGNLDRLMRSAGSCPRSVT
jgi:segregation and condensation protein B